MKNAIRSRVPLRISFAGGGTDIPPYCDERGGAILGATISLFAYASLVPNDRNTINIDSADFERTIEYSFGGKLIEDQQFRLTQLIVEHFRANHALEKICTGLDVRLHCAAPPGSGLGSSSAIAVALVGCLTSAVHLPLNGYGIANLAHRIERMEAGIAGGKQDQFATTFGGFNFIEFKGSDTIVHPLRLSHSIVNELEYSLVFAYIGGQRFSGGIIDRQVKNYTDNQADAVAAMDTQKELAYLMRDALLTGRLHDFGTLLNEAWIAKKKMAQGISNERIDEIYAAGRRAGAMGGKLSGAGGGGFMMFFCKPQHRFEVQRALKAAGCELIDPSFTSEGISTWRV
jgi:D-glycero-alpha-D-manno-heptose-7-phosphate kinase